MIRALIFAFALLLFASCAPGDPNSDGNLGGVQNDSKPNIVITTSNAPAGPYQSSCQNCGFAENFQLGSDATQSAPMQTLYCQDCFLPGESDSQPALLLVAKDSNGDDLPVISFCEASGGWGALVPCDCTDTACIDENTLVPSTVSSNNSYIDSCAGCSIYKSAAGNLVLACAGCLEKDGVTFAITAATLAKGVLEESINNCKGQLEARANHLDCKSDKSDWEKYLEKVWDKVKGAFSAVFVYLDNHQPASPDGDPFYSGAADDAAGADGDTVDAIVDTITAILEALSIL